MYSYYSDYIIFMKEKKKRYSSTCYGSTKQHIKIVS